MNHDMFSRSDSDYSDKIVIATEYGLVAVAKIK